MSDTARVRLDKWLWAARMYKTRALAAEEIGHGRVVVNGLAAKPSREVHVGDRIELRLPGNPRPHARRACAQRPARARPGGPGALRRNTR